MNAAVACDQAPVVVAFPTIMSGLVLCWYASEQHYMVHGQIASASREHVMLADEAHATPELLAATERARETLAAAYTGPFGAKDEAKYVAAAALATHEPKGILAARGLRPITNRGVGLAR